MMSWHASLNYFQGGHSGGQRAHLLLNMVYGRVLSDVPAIPTQGVTSRADCPHPLLAMLLVISLVITVDFSHHIVNKE